MLSFMQWRNSNIHFQIYIWIKICIYCMQCLWVFLLFSTWLDSWPHSAQYSPTLHSCFLDPLMFKIFCWCGKEVLECLICFQNAAANDAVFRNMQHFRTKKLIFFLFLCNSVCMYNSGRMVIFTGQKHKHSLTRYIG